jgi:hypothetical protein
MSLTGVILVLYFRVEIFRVITEYILPTVVSRQRQFAECLLCAAGSLDVVLDHEQKLDCLGPQRLWRIIVRSDSLVKQLPWGHKS